MPAVTRTEKAEKIKKATGSKASEAATKVKSPKATKAASKSRVSKAEKEAAEPKAPEKAESGKEGPDAPTIGIIIEACKQCQAFKTRAIRLQDLLTENIPDLDITINPEKPRKGCFEVRNVETGEQYVSLLNMPRPFPPLKALDIDELAAEILGKLEGK